MDTQIPDEAVALACAATGISAEPGDMEWEEMLAALKAVAPLIIAADLVRLASELESDAEAKRGDVPRDPADALRAEGYADALDDLAEELRLRATTTGDDQ